MGIGEGIAQGIQAGQMLFRPLTDRLSEKRRLAQEMQMQQARQASELQQLQKRAEIERQNQLADRELAQNTNLQANQATLDLLGNTGFITPETFNKENLKYLTPQQLNAVADDWSRRQKENSESERKRKAASALYNTLPDSLKKNITAEDVVNLDPTVLSSLYNQESNRLQRDSSREDNQAFRQSILGQQFENQKVLKQLAASLRPAKSSGGSGGRGGRTSGNGGTSGYKQTRDGNFVKVDRRGNPTGQIIRARDAYNMGITNIDPRQARPKPAQAQIPVPKIDF